MVLAPPRRTAKNVLAAALEQHKKVQKQGTTTDDFSICDLIEDI